MSLLTPIRYPRRVYPQDFGRVTSVTVKVISCVLLLAFYCCKSSSRVYSVVLGVIDSPSEHQPRHVSGRGLLRTWRSSRYAEYSSNMANPRCSQTSGSSNANSEPPTAPAIPAAPIHIPARDRKSVV